MNFKACVFAAAMLLTGNVVSANDSVELVSIEAPVTQNLNQRIDAAILAILVEDYATDFYSLSVEDAWTAYYNGSLEITEIVPGEEYKMVHGGILEMAILDTQN